MSNYFKALFYSISFLSCFFILQAEYQIQKVDFLSQYGLKINGTGPLLVKTDITWNRIILVNTNTSSISIIDGNDYSIINIPIKTRVPQYLKMEAMTINKRTGNIYVIGNRSLHIVFPEKQTSISIDTGEQYEMAAVYEKNGNAFLVGRESRFLAIVQLKSKKVKRVKWLENVDRIQNLNQTPPPPIRKVICDNELQRVVAIDGYTSTLYLFSANSGKLLKMRKIAVKGGSRWHMAGYNQKTHHLYTVIETAKREVIEALKIDVVNGKDAVVELPGLHEGVGINYNPKREEVYIPYDNDPSVHMVDFKPLKNEKKSRITEIKIPVYGNDASAIDETNDILYIASWGYGEVEVIDLKTRILIKRIRDVGVIPHMFNMAFNSKTGKLVIPIGATAVNGSFGASLTIIDPVTEKMSKIYTGWAPVDLLEMESKEGFLVFNSEDQVAEVSQDGSFKTHTLPCRFINKAIKTNNGNIYVSYGPHQSYWPVVYIWAAKNGILGINPNTMKFYTRRIPRLAQKMILDKEGVFYALQNNWGKEKQFLITLPDEIRSPNLGDMRIEIEDTLIRETTQRILEYDTCRHWLYLVRVGETDKEPGILQVLDLATKKVMLKYPTGLTPTDLVFDDTFIYIANFDSDSIAIINKDDFSVQKIKTGKKPFKLALWKDTLYCINHNDNSLQVFGKESKTYAIPFPGRPGNLISTGKKLIITSHTSDAFHVLAYSPSDKSITLVHREAYPYGETCVDTNNTAFYVRGQFADGIFEINQIKEDKKGRLWITDYLSGKLYIITDLPNS